MKNIILEIKDIQKMFPGVKALDGASLSIVEGECHALLGANGAGKSTLIKILAGVYKSDSGDIFVNGQKTEITDVTTSHRLGISVIHQELMLVPHMSITENIFLGRETNHKGTPFITKKQMSQETKKLLDTFGLEIDPNKTVASLSLAQQQMVEICRAMSMDARIIIMDEPTATLSPKEVDQLFDYIRALKKQKISVIYVSHRLEELFEITDRISVYRDGRYIQTFETQKANRSELVNAMVGKKLGEFFQKSEYSTGNTLLEVRNLNSKGVLSNINFTLNKGEILGFSGIVGAGRTELVETIFGVRPYDSGEIYLEGKELKIREPIDAIKAGIGLVPESRKEHGLNLTASVADNMTIQVLDSFMKLCVIDRTLEQDILKKHIDMLSIKTPSVSQSVAKLSGGNQQKVVMAKWLALHTRILILDEPTRGIDVGAKVEIYQIMNNLVKKGFSIIMVSSELSEILNMCDRILVMHAGKITARFNKNEATQEKIMEYATGLTSPQEQEE